jgi:hypothetical protein
MCILKGDLMNYLNASMRGIKFQIPKKGESQISKKKKNTMQASGELNPKKLKSGLHTALKML